MRRNKKDLLKRGKVLSWEWVAENESFIVEYNKELNMYRVAYFDDDGHYEDEILFDREAGIDG